MLKERLLPPISGIYRIRNRRTSDAYIGASTNVRRRCMAQRIGMERDRYGTAPKLRAARRKYSAKAFVFELLIICAVEDLCLYENLAIKALKPAYNERPARPSWYWPKQGDISTLDHWLINALLWVLERVL